MNLVDFEVVFKSVSKRDGGEFVNSEGVTVPYDPAYVVKFDENRNGEITERRLKFPVTNKNLYNKLHELDSYSKITLVCNVELYTSNAKVTPIDIK